MESKNEGDLRWYRLDNSAKIYPAIVSDRQTTLFRVTATLKTTVDPLLLQKALEKLYDRFPYFNVSLRKGLFWNYLEQNRETPFVHHDTPSPCENINTVYYNGYLYKVLFYKRRIAVEFSHVLTDGYGGLEFLKSLILEYLKLSGAEVKNDGSIIEPESSVDPAEISDDHNRYAAIHGHEIQKERNLFGGGKAFQIKGHLLPVGRYDVITGIVPVEDLKKISKRFDATVTELLTAVYIRSLALIRARKSNRRHAEREIVIQVPVNMRKIFESSSMRNFSLFVTPRIGPGTPDIGNLVSTVKDYMKKTTKKEHLLKIMVDNISVGENIWVRHVPLFIKLPIVRYIANTSGSTQYSGTLSNIGLVRLPESVERHVEEMGLMLGPDPHSKANCSVLGFRDRIFITFGRVVRESELERLFFTELVKLGAHVKLRSNC